MRGDEVALIPQDPLTSLNPTMTIGRQIAEAVCASTATSPRQQARERAARGAAAGGDAAAGGAAGPVPPRAVGRAAPAGDDRHGAGVRAQAAHRRRADHRPRRDHPGPDPRPHRRPARAAGDGGDPHHPRHGGHRRPHRPGRGHVRRQGRRGGRRPSSSSAGCATPTPRRCWPRCPKLDQDPGRPPAQHPRAARPTCPQSITNCRFSPRCRYATEQLPGPRSRRSTGTVEAEPGPPASPASTRSTHEHPSAGAVLKEVRAEVAEAGRRPARAETLAERRRHRWRWITW